MLVEEHEDSSGTDGAAAAVGRAEHQGPDVDGTVRLVTPAGAPVPAVGALVPAVVVGSEGVDLLAEVSGPSW